MTTETFDLIVWTDQLDYAPDTYATFTAENVTVGGTVEFQVLHVTGPGEDGLFGTLDDVLDAGVDGVLGTADDGSGTTGAGHDPFLVTDGGVGDLDGVADGTIVTDWYVNPDDSLDETFLLTATDTSTGEVATTSFTDTIPTGNRIGSHFVYEIPNTEYVPGLVTGYREGDSASFLVEVTVSDADIAKGNDGLPGTEDDGVLTLDFSTVLDLVADSGADGYAFIDLGNFNDTVTPPIPSTAGGNTVVDGTYRYDDAETLGVTTDNSNGVYFTGNGSVTVLQPNDGIDPNIDNLDTITITDLAYEGADFNSPVNTQTWTVAYQVTDGDGNTLGDPANTTTYFFLYGGVLAQPGDVAPDDTDSDGVTDSTSIADFGAADAGNFQADVQSQGAGNKTIPFTGSLIIKEPDIFITKEIDRDDDGTFESPANADEYSFTAFLNDGDGNIEIGAGGDDTLTTYTLLTDANGQVRFENVENGTYWITETQVDFTEGTYEFWDILINDSGTPSGVFGEVAQVTVFEGTIKDVQEADVTFQNIPLQFTPNASYTIDKTVTDVDGAGSTGVVDAAGDIISYQIAVTNTGNTFLDGVVVTDQVESGTVDPLTLVSGDTDGDGRLDADETIDGVDTDNDGQLDNAEIWIYNDSYTAQQSDIDNNGGGDGDIDNTATVSSNVLPSESDSEQVGLVQNASIVIDKAAVDTDDDGLIWNDTNGNSLPDADETVDYSFDVTNDGNVTLFNVSVTDNDGVVVGDLSGLTDEDGDSVADDMAAGATATASGTYTLLQSDIDAGTYQNTADADAVDPNDAPVNDDDTETVTLPQNASIVIDKAAVDTDDDGLIWNDTNGNSLPDADETVDYSFDVTNDGNVTLFNVSVTDNDGVVVGDLSGLTDEDGDSVADDMAAGATATASGTYTLLQSDIDAGTYQNTADADAVDPNDAPVNDDDTETVTLPQNASIVIDKAAVDTDDDGLIWNDTNGNSLPDADETVDYSFDVTNDGNVTLFNVSVTDNDGVVVGDLSGLTDEDGDSVADDMAAGATATASGTYTLLQSDIDAGTYQNTADADAVDPNDAPVNDDDTETVTLPQNASIVIDKAAVDTDDDGLIWNDTNGNSLPDADETVDYSFDVTNDGNVTLFNVSVTDNDGVVVGDLSGLTDEDGDSVADDMAAGATATASGTYTLLQSDIDAGTYQNTADADAVDPNDAPVNDDDTETVTLPQNASIVIDKAAVDTDDDGLIWNDTNGNSLPDADETVDYSFDVTNDGNVTLFNVSVTDNDGVVVGDLSGLTDEDGDSVADDMAAGATATASGTYTLLQSDIDAGTYQNTADADAVDPNDAPVNDDDTETVTLPQNASIVIDKAAVDTDDDGLIWNDTNGNSLPDADETVDYSFDVTNDGNVTLFNVSVTDNDGVVVGDLSGLTDEDGDSVADDMAAGATATASGTYTLLQSDIDAGTYQNTADADAVDPNDAPVNDDDTETVTLPQNASIVIDKAAVDTDDDGLIWNDTNGNSLPDADETVDYSFDVTNDGNVTLFNVSVTDNDGVVVGDLSGLTDEDGDSVADDMAAGATATASGTYTLLQSDIDAGTYQNTADADAVDPNDAPVNDDDTETVTLPQNASIVIDKAAVDTDDDGLIWNDTNGNSLPDADETVDYSFDVTNDGNVTLFNVSVTDNDGVVVGDLSGLTDEDGDSVADDMAAGATATASGTYTLLQSDIDAGTYQNTADADAVDPNDAPVNDDDTETVTLPQNASIVIDKAAVDTDDDGLIWNDTNGNSLPDADETVDYSFDVTNDGNVTLFNVSVTDNDGVVVGDLSGLTDEDGDSVADDMAAGATATASGTYTLLQSDIDAGTYQNTADADAVDPNDAPVNDDDTETVTLPQNASIVIDKAAVDTDDDGLIWNDTNGNSLPDADETVDYSFDVTNDGNVTLFNVSVTDNDGVVVGDLSGLTDEDGDSVADDMAAGATATASGTYTLLQSDIDAGTYQNTADADAVDPNDAPVNDDDTETVTLPQNASIVIDKAAVDTDDDGLIWNDTNGNSLPDADETVDYSFDVTNDGNVTLFNVSVTDNDGVVVGDLSGLTDEDGDSVADDMAAGATATASGTYTLLQSDIDAGTYQNTADADAVDPNDAPVNDDDTETVTLPQNASIVIDKAAVDTDDDGLIWNDTNGNSLPDADETVDYSFDVTNDGNVTLFNVSVTDNDGVVVGDLSGLTDEDGDSVADDMAAGATATASGTYTLLQSDIDAGTYQNTADADAVDPNDAPVNDDDTETVTLPQNASIVIDKAAVDTDDDGLIWNDTNGNSLPDADETVDYSFDVTNDGNVTLFNVSVTDNDGVVVGDLSGLTDEDGDSVADDMAAGATATASGTYTLLQSDIDAGTYQNTADADAVDPNDAPVNDDDTETVTLPQNASIVIDKAAVDTDDDGLIWNDTNGNSLPDADETVDYSFDVTNDGNVTLFNVSVTDNDGVVVGDLSGLTDEDGDSVADDMAAGATATASGTYTLLQSDIDAGTYQNTADADAVDPNDAPVNDDDTETVTLPQNASIVIDKAAVDTDDDGLIWNDTNGNSLPDADETVDYSFDVTNDGNVTLFNVSVTDNDGVVVGDLSGLTDEDGDSVADDMAAGATATASGTYTLLQSDIDAGTYQNTADADAVDPNDAPVNDDDTETVTLPQNASIVIDKAAVDTDDDGLIWNDTNGNSLPDADETVDYSFDVTNDGNVTLFNVSVTDNDGVVVGDLSGLTDEDGDSVADDMAAGATATASGTYTLLQSDIDAGTYQNTADADAVDPNDAPVNDDDTETVTLPQNASIVIDKAAVDTDDDGLIWNDTNGNSLPDADETVDYSFDVTNDGNVTLFNVSVTDNDGVVVGDLSGLTDEDGDSVADDMAAGATATASGTYTLLQSDIDAGTYQNTADADAVDPNDAPVNDDDTETVTLPQNASIVIDKAAVDTDDDGLIWNDTNGNSLPDADETVDYSFDVTNDGNVTLFNVSVTDNDGVVVGDLSGLTDEDGDSVADDMAAGATATASGTYTLLQSDIDAGTYQNTADADAVDPNDAPVNDDDTETVTLPQNASIVIDKAAVDTDDDGLIWNDTNGNSLPDADETVDYSFDVTNDGNVTLFNVSVTDNDGVVVGDLSGLTDEDGDSVADDMAAGATATASGTYTLLQSDIDAGTYQNTADADAVDPNDAPVNDDDTETVTLPQNASIVIDKAAVDTDDDGLIWNDTNGNSLPDADETVDYSFDVTNDGNVTLFNVSVTDNDGVVVGDLSGLTDEDGDSVADDMAAGATATASGTYTLLQSDIDAGTYQNTADADAVDPNDAPVNDDDTETVTLPQNASIDVTKTAIDSDGDGFIWNDANGNGSADAGETIDYGYTVTNDGNVTLYDVTLEDDNGTPDIISDDFLIDLSGLTNEDNDGVADDLAVGVKAEGSYLYTITDADVAAAQHINLATGTGIDPNGDPVTDTDPETVLLPQLNQRSIQIQDIWGVDITDGATVDTPYTPTAGKKNTDLVLDGNKLEGAFSITDESEDGKSREIMVQIQGLDVDIQYDADPSSKGVDWQLLDLSDSTLKIWVDSDVDPLTGEDLGGIDGVIDIDLGTAGPDLENTESLSISEGEKFDFSPIAVNFQEDINVLFELELGDAAWDQLSSVYTDNDLRVTSEVFIGGRDEPDAPGTPLAFKYTEVFEDFDFDSLF